MSVVIGIDVGGSTTKIVGFRKDGEKRELIAPLFVKATDPVTSIYGAFGKFTDVNSLAFSDIEKVLTTGVGASYLSKPIYALPCGTVPEFKSIGLGGLYLSHLQEAIIVSMGTGTAIVHARAGQDTDYLGGTGVGAAPCWGCLKKCWESSRSTTWNSWRQRATFLTLTCGSAISPTRGKMFPCPTT